MAFLLITSFWFTLAAMAPWLLLGFAAAGILSVCFPAAFVERHLGGGGVGPVVKASVLGVPLPVCSCGVIPLGAGLFRQGASRGATSSFMLSTPQTGVDSILATYALLGPVLAVVRPVVALVNGIVGGLLIDTLVKPGAPTPHADETPAGSCCSDAKAPCCDSEAAAKAAPAPAWVRALRYGLVTLPADLAGALVLGVLLAALLTASVPPDALAPYLGGGVLAMFAAVAVSTPLYVCATASIPIGLGLLAAGASPGAVLAFLIAGPATNAATVAVTWKLLGKRTGLLYLLNVVATAIAAGLLLDELFSIEQLRLPPAARGTHDHGLGLGPLDHLWAAALALLLLPAIMKRLQKIFKPLAPSTEPTPVS